MNPSRLFILRPVATTLLMVAIVLAGFVAYRQLPDLRPAAGRLPDDPGVHVLPGREPGGDGLVGHRAAGAPVRPDPGPQADVVDELRRRLGGDAAVRSRASARRRGAGRAGGDQCVLESRPAGPSRAAGLQQGEPGRRADPDAGVGFEDPAAAGNPESRRHAPGAEALADLGRRSRDAVGRTAAGRAGAGQPQGARRQQSRPRGRAHRDRGREREEGEGQLRRPEPVVHDRRERSAALGRRISPDRGRLPQRRAAPSVGRGRHRRRRGEHPSRGLDERRAGRDPQHPAPARRERHRGGRPHQARAAAAPGLAPCRRRCRDPDRSHRHDPRLGARRPGRTHAGDRAGRDGHLPVPAQPPGDAHPERRGAGIPGRHVRVHVPLRLLHQQPHAHGARRGHRVRGRRCDRGDREHRALRRARRAAARGRAEGLAPDRLHDHLAHLLARRGADPAALHGRGGRAAVPRVRHHARRRDPHLRGRVAHADADDVREAPATDRRGGAPAAVPRNRARFSTA